MTTKASTADHSCPENDAGGPIAARGRLAESSVGQAMLTDYGNSLQSLPELTPVGQRLPGCPLDPAGSENSEQLHAAAEKKRRGGRPKLPETELRKIVIPVRFTEGEARSLRSEAANCGISVAALIVIHALQRKPPRLVSAVTLDTFRQISGIATNLNQLTYRANCRLVTDSQLTVTLKSVQRELAALVVALSEISKEPRDDE